MKKNAFLLLALSLASLTVVAFQNCGDKVSVKKLANEDDQETLDQPSTGVSACVARSKLQNSTSATDFGFLKTKVARVLGSTNVISGSEDLVVVLDNDCLKQNGAKSLFSQKAASKGIVDQSGLVAYRMTLGVDFPLSSMDRVLSEDTCLHSVDKHVEYQLFFTASPPSNSVVNDPRYSALYHLAFIKHSQVYSQVFNASNGINRDVRIGVLDSGVDLFHPDLSTTVLRNSSGEPMAYNPTNNSNIVTDAGFHGTHVAGLALAAGNNAEGVSGVLGKNAKLLAVKVATDSSSNILNPTLSLDAIVNGMRWAADHGAEVINVSLGGSADSPTLREAVAYAANKGALVVIAAGNNGRLLDPNFKIYPAVYSKDIEGAVTIGSVDSTSSQISSFSNYSSTYVDLLAPGSDGTRGILSTIPTNLSSSVRYASAVNVQNSSGGTTTSPIHGTSMASPVASGAAAMMINLIKSRGLTPTPRQVERVFLLGARRNSGYNSYSSNGQVLDLVNMITRVDRETGIDTSSSTPRTALKGEVILSKQPQSAERLVGQTVSFETDLSEAGSLLAKFQWYKNGNPIIGANREVLELKGLSAADVGTYTVKATLGSSIVTSNPATLKVGLTYCN